MIEAALDDMRLFSRRTGKTTRRAKRTASLVERFNSRNSGKNIERPPSLMLVYRLDGNAELNERRRRIAARCSHMGLSVDFEISRDADEMMMLLSAPDDLLEATAERNLMDKKLLNGEYSNYKMTQKHQFQPANSMYFFTSLETIRLMQCVISNEKIDGGCSVHLDDELSRGTFSQIVPLHEREWLMELMMPAWAAAPLSAWPEQPLDLVRDYYGEKIALYFAFVQTLTRW